MSRVLSYITSNVWAMRQAEFDSMTLVAARNLERLEALAARAEINDRAPKPDAMMTTKPGVRLANTRYVEMRDGVALIDLNGRIAKRMDFFTEVCEGGTSTETLLKDFTACIENPNVTAIVFDIDSPGGEAFGVGEVANAIYAARGKKPMTAYVSGLGCSGAYWIAAATNEIVCDRSAFLGSIGVVSVWIDDTQAYKMLGFDKKVITSSNAPKKRLDLNKPEDLAEFQAELDGMEKVFIGFVAKARNKTVEQVKTDFNQGGVLTGDAAVKVGMADKTGSLEQVIKSLAKKGKNTGASFGAINEKGDFDMGFKDEFKAFAVKHGLLLEDAKNDNAPDASNENSAAAAANTSAHAPQTAAEIQAANTRAAAAEKELADFKAERAEQKQEQLKTEAEAFVKAEVAAGRMTPAENKSGEFVSLYIQAATDDAANPLASGSRLDNLKTIQSNRKSHGFTSEMLAPGSGAQILAGDDSPASQMARDADAQADAYDKQMGGGKPKFEVVKK